MYEYYREKWHVNHFWELKDQQLIIFNVPQKKYVP